MTSHGQHTDPTAPTGIPSSGKHYPKGSGSIQIEIFSDSLDFFITREIKLQKMKWFQEGRMLILGKTVKQVLENNTERNPSET